MAIIQLRYPTTTFTLNKPWNRTNWSTLQPSSFYSYLQEIATGPTNAPMNRFIFYGIVAAWIPVIYAFYHRGMVNNTDKYGSPVIYAVYFTVIWSMSWTNMEMPVSFLVTSVVVCVWSMTRKLCGRPASVGFIQACPNNGTLLHNY